MKRFAALMLIMLLVLSCSAALAELVSCPVGGFSLNLPDQFREMPLDSARDPQLCLYWRTGDGSLSIQAYADYMGEVAYSDLFQVLDGTEKESGEININGMRMLYARTDTYIMYSWMDRGNNVSLYFNYSRDDASVRSTVESIIWSVSFDAGH